MKLAKKMLVSVIALALVAALAVTSFAAAPVLTAAPTNLTVGETVEIVVTASGINGLEAAGLEISYDKDALEVISVAEKGCFDGSLYAAGNPEAGLVTAGAAYATACEVDSAAAVKITVKALKTGATKLDVAITEWAGTDAPANFSINVTVAEKPSETEPAPTTAPVAPTKPNKDIVATGDAGIAVVAGVMAIAAVAFVATRKKDEQ